MPTYDYKCPICDLLVEVQHSISELDNPSEETVKQISCNEHTCPRLKPFSFEQWYDQNEDQVNAELAESGATREMDFDSEREFEKRYEQYLDQHTPQYGTMFKKQVSVAAFNSFGSLPSNEKKKVLQKRSNEHFKREIHERKMFMDGKTGKQA